MNTKIYFPILVQETIDIRYNEMQMPKNKNIIITFNNFIEYLYNYNCVTSYNIVAIIKKLFSIDDIKEKILNGNSDNFNKIKTLIDDCLASLDINNINNKLMKESLYFDCNYKQTYVIKNELDKKDLFISEIIKHDYMYKDYLFMFFNDFDYNEIRKNCHIFKKSSNTLYIKYVVDILNYFNRLFYEIGLLFEKDILFPYNLVKYGIVKNYNFRFKSIINKLAGGYYRENNNDFGIVHRLAFDIISGLITIKTFYYIEFDGFNNWNSSKYSRLPSSELYELIKSTFSNITSDKIILLYRISSVPRKEIKENDIKEIDSFILEFKDKVKNSVVIKQGLSTNNRTKVKHIIEYLKSYKDNNIAIYDIKTNLTSCEEREVSIIKCKINVIKENITFDVALKSIYDDIVWYIYYNNKIVAKDICFRPNDFDRVIYFINYKWKNWVKSSR